MWEWSGWGSSSALTSCGPWPNQLIFQNLPFAQKNLPEAIIYDIQYNIYIYIIYIYNIYIINKYTYILYTHNIYILYITHRRKGSYEVGARKA